MTYVREPRAAVSAFLGRYRGQTRVHTESDLRVFLRWCTDRDLDPLTAARADVERYVRWLQDVRGFQPHLPFTFSKLRTPRTRTNAPNAMRMPASTRGK